MAQDVEKRMAARREDLMRDEMRRMQRQHQLGFAVMTGHNLKDTNSSYKW